MYVTLFVGIPLLEKAEKEVARYFLPEGEEYLKESIRYENCHIYDALKKLNITRIVAIPSGSQSFDLKPIQLEFLKGYAALLSGELIQRTPDIEKFHEKVGTPQLVILDVRQFLRLVRSLT